MADRERKLTRRRFLQHSAMGTAVSTTAAGILLRSDAQSHAQNDVTAQLTSLGDPSPYAYDDEEWALRNPSDDDDGGDGSNSGGG